MSRWDVSGGPVVRNSPSSVGDVYWVPGQGTKITHASWPKTQNIKQKEYCNKFNILFFIVTLEFPR